jgi:hypothetical protein
MHKKIDTSASKFVVGAKLATSVGPNEKLSDSLAQAKESVCGAQYARQARELISQNLKEILIDMGLKHSVYALAVDVRFTRTGYAQVCTVVKGDNHVPAYAILVHSKSDSSYAEEVWIMVCNSYFEVTVESVRMVGEWGPKAGIPIFDGRSVFLRPKYLEI